MIPGTAPVIVRKAAPAPGGYTFTMVAGNFADALFGFSQEDPGSGTPGFGSIVVQPDPEVRNLFTGFLNNFFVFGDMTTAWAGETLWVDGVSYPFTDSNWFYDGDQNITGGSWAVLEDAPPLVEGITYFVEIK